MHNSLRCAFLCLIALTVAVSDGSLIGRSQVVGPTAPAPVLTGKWKLDTGETIDITQSAAGEVTAKFSPPVACWNLQRTFLLKAKIKTTGSGENATVTLEQGSFWACTRTEKMWRECGVQKLFETKVRNVTVSPFSITGEVLRPGYYLPDGEFRRCRPDSTYESWEPFSLTPLCRPVTPWFDKSGNCANAQKPVMTSPRPGDGTLSICGVPILQYTVSEPNAAKLNLYNSLLEADLLRQIGSTVCCQAFLNAVNTGQPCNPRFDLDCDGKPNYADIRIETPGPDGLPDIRFPEINIYSTPPGASVASFPAGLNPDDPGFVPNSSGCDCKWSLIKGELNCGTGGQGHSYVATWECPTTGRQVTTTKNAPATAPCP
jgi:hypothetical protein